MDDEIFVDAPESNEDEIDEGNNIDEEEDENELKKFQKYIENEKKKQDYYVETYSNVLEFFESKVNFMFNNETVKFSVGTFTKNQTISHRFTMMSFNHMPANIILDTYFRNSVKPTLNRQKSFSHIESLIKLNYPDSIYETAPLIFAIMTRRVKNEVDTSCGGQYQFLYKSAEDDFIKSDKYMIYTLDGQHRLSTIYKYVENSNNFSFLNKKYIDFKFILVTSVEEYKTIFFAVNNSLPQKQETEVDGNDNFEVNLPEFVFGVNKHFADLYKSKYNKKSTKPMICENESIKNPRPPCIHVEKLKSSNKLIMFLKKYGNDEFIRKMIKLNGEYSQKDITFFGYDKNYSSRDYDNVITYGFYLGLHKNQPMKWLDDLS